jgi:alkylation response protein AidB-like acyl-CoA dehydrogenase
MWIYEPPLRDMQFVIEELLDAPAQWSGIEAFAELDAGTARSVLAEAGRFAAEVLAPTNADGDLHGCRWDAGRVSTPPGFREAYRAYCEGGWPALACDPAWGGQGLPLLLHAALTEMLNSANHAWNMYAGLAHGAYETLRAHAAPELQQRYLPRIVSGEWLATMCLTEPHAGTDLGLLRTRAEPVGADPRSGSEVRVSGCKIFASGAEHDLTDNIIHLVLARLPGAPSGSKGLSLALVPKVLPDGARNAVHCDGIEKKMGLAGSATCAVRFEGATGWLVGEPHRGLPTMFVMMNAARLLVAMQGLGHLEMASQNARRYAHERRQSRAPARPEGQDAGSADPIVLHPAVRRTLWTLQALAEGQRVLAFRIAQWLDDAEHHPDAAHRERAQALAALLTPVLKAFCTDSGHHGADAALQVWGGHGYVREYGIEQSVRDSRVAMIYEGTNEIQAIDLLVRKVLDDGGRRLALLLDELEREAAACEAEPALADVGRALRAHADALAAATAALEAGRRQDPEWPYRVADDYLRATGLLLMGWAWARTARVASARAGDAWYEGKLAAARFGLQWLLPEIDWRLQRVRAAEAELPWVPA